MKPVVGCFHVLGVRIGALQISDAVVQMEEWIYDRGQCHSVAATSMHGIVEAQQDPAFKEILNSTDLVVPDGMPLVWLGRRRGHDLRRRVYGPELLLAFCKESSEEGYRHFFYGGEPGVADHLAAPFKARFPGRTVVGAAWPRSRPM